MKKSFAALIWAIVSLGPMADRAQAQTVCSQTPREVCYAPPSGFVPSVKENTTTILDISFQDMSGSHNHRVVVYAKGDANWSNRLTNARLSTFSITASDKQRKPVETSTVSLTLGGMACVGTEYSFNFLDAWSRFLTEYLFVVGCQIDGPTWVFLSVNNKSNPAKIAGSDRLREILAGFRVSPSGASVRR